MTQDWEHRSVVALGEALVYIAFIVTFMTGLVWLVFPDAWRFLNEVLLGVTKR